MTKLESAKALRDMGFFIFPLIPNDIKKRPMVKRWQHVATRDMTQINQWWGKWPDANIGVHCGKFGDDEQPLLVVDVDNKEDKDGDGTMFELELAGYDFPPTLTAVTPTGGYHMIYLAPGPVKTSADTFGKWIDIRAHGGYIVGVGSTIEGKQYRWK